MALPLLVQILCCINGAPVFSETMEQFCGVDFLQGIETFLGEQGWDIPTALWQYAVWVAYVWVTHMLIDVILFVPKLGEKLAKRWFGGASDV